MKGIAITLATREDSEAIGAIEKLTGIKLPRVEGDEPKAAPVEEAPREEKPSRSRSRSRGKPKAELVAEPKVEAAAPKVEAPREERPAAPKAARKPKAPQESDDDWNGPVPGFLNFSAL
jgi:hypothetical protein